MLLSFCLHALAAASAVNAAVIKRGSPTVTIASPDATIQGASAAGVDSFRGIPFAVPPVGKNRLKAPQPIETSLGSIQATDAGAACPQLFFDTEYDTYGFPTSVLGRIMDVPFFQRVLDFDEDCLFLHIWRPANVKKDAKLPILFWIFGGGFELGASSMYDGAQWVQESINMGQPIIFVSVSYRVGGFGFLPGKEVKEAGIGNLGLLDQRMGLQWVSDNIEQFGGDPEKVTIWGQSAGSISVFDQMLLFNGNNTYNNKQLFRAGIMNSGSLVPAETIDSSKAQKIFDSVADHAGCSGKEDAVQCLRDTDYYTLLGAANSARGIFGYTSLALSYLPRPDGRSLPQSPDELLQSGKIAKVPIIIGDQEDEGTMFALFQKNITSKSELVDYLAQYYFQQADRSVLTGLVNCYNDTAEDGAPFRTGNENNIFPQFKRMAAILGDFTFTLTRRIVLNILKSADPNLKAWSYLSSYDHGLPILGTFHASDLIQVFYGIRHDYASAAFKQWYISFVNHLDPNKGKDSKYLDWPEWTAEGKLVHVNADDAHLIDDDFRSEASTLMEQNISNFHI